MTPQEITDQANKQKWFEYIITLQPYLKGKKEHPTIEGRICYAGEGKKHRENGDFIGFAGIKKGESIDKLFDNNEIETAPF